MITADLPALPQGSKRIPFSLASARQVSQALAYATERLEAHFPMLDWPTWSDTFRDVKPDLVVQGPAVWLEGPALERLVQRLASSSAYPVLDPPGYRPPAAEIAQPLPVYQAPAQLKETPGGSSPLLYQPMTTLAQSHATAAQVYAATATDSEVINTSAAAVTALNPPAATPAPPAPAQAPERRLSTARRTFSNIVQQHPRANGKRGFTVRELCRAMRISAASLREAHANPGRLSLNAVSALAALMQEPLLPVLADLLAGAGTRKKRRNR
jgi:hypothetical protein